MYRSYHLFVFALHRKFVFGVWMLMICFCTEGMLPGAGSSLLSVGTASVAGSVATVPLSFISGTGNTAGIEWTVSVPGATAIALEASQSAISAGKTLSCNGNTCLLAGLNGNTIADGVVATLFVTLPQSAKGPIPVQLTNVVEALPDGTAGSITSSNGSIAIDLPMTQPVISTVQCTPTTLTGGQVAKCSVGLNVPATNNGTAVSMSSSSKAVVLPKTVTIPTNASSATFTAVTGNVTADETAIITASLNGSSQQLTLFLISDVTLSSLQCADATLFPNASTTCTVSLTAAAQTTMPITLSVQNSYLASPTTVLIPSGSTTATFIIAAASAAASNNVILTAALANGVSTAFAVTILAPPVLQLQGSLSEVNGISNGSKVNPSIAPPGFTGTVVVNGSGSANFSPIEAGNGVYFRNCCDNQNNAYYKFTGSEVGHVFDAVQGQISFYVRSSHSFAERRASAASPRFVFDVRDGNNTHLFDFATAVQTNSSGTSLLFNYLADGYGSYYFVPAGMEDHLFGNGVVLKVGLTWNGKESYLYLNDALVKSVPYTRAAHNWTAASNFDLGAYEFLTFGGYSVSDDVIEGFTVAATDSEASPTRASTPSVPLVISGIHATGITSSSATITSVTETPSHSQ